MRRFALLPDLSEFAGDWCLTRTIVDHQGPSSGQFDGMAHLLSRDDGLLYHEIGVLTLVGQPPIKAERRYLWTKSANGIDVSFEDRRPFHMIQQENLKATHWCDPDTYRVAYVFDDWPRWRSVWDVSGPRKSYRLENFYDRAAR